MCVDISKHTLSLIMYTWRYSYKYSPVFQVKSRPAQGSLVSRHILSGMDSDTAQASVQKDIEHTQPWPPAGSAAPSSWCTPALGPSGRHFLEIMSAFPSLVLSPWEMRKYACLLKGLEVDFEC